MAPRKETTIYDIAKKLNLSASTVSRGLRNNPAIKKETVALIQETAREMNYQQNTFASNLRKNRSNTIAVLFPRFESSFMPSVISGIEKVVRSKGYQLLASQSFDSSTTEIENLKALFNSRVEGLLVSLSPETEELNHLDLFLRKDIPVVLFDRVQDRSDCRCTTVVIDNRRAGYDVTRHLLDQGCRQIAYVGENTSCSVFGERYKGYLDALEEARIRPADELVFCERLNEEVGELILDDLLAIEPKVDGIFCANDVSAVSLMTALKKEGFQIPEDIAISGFNNTNISRIVEPALTTVNYPGVEMGRLAAASLMAMLDQDSHVATQSVVLRHELIVRESSLRKKR